MRGAGRWFQLDMEHHHGAVSSSHPDPGPVPCERSFAPNRFIDLWRNQPGSQTVGHGALCRTGRWKVAGTALRPHIDSSDEAAKCATYIIRNRRRMRYPKFHAQGLCTSAGVLEAGCKVAIGTRLKRAGMHWSVSGANAIIALHCAKLSGRFEDFWARRSTPLKAAA
jgi:hypothetical protein